MKLNRILPVLIVTLLAFFQHSKAQTPSTNKNYVLEQTPRIPGLKTAASLSGKTVDEVNTTVNYLDGLGRPLQSVSYKAAPSKTKDMVGFMEYDEMGRENIRYMPYASSATANAAYRTASTTDQASFYNTATNIAHDTKPWSETAFDTSPLSRVKEQGAVGSNWQPSGLNKNTVERGANGASEVYQWEVTDQGACKLASSHYYSANTLSVTTYKDENWRSADGNDGTVKEYTDKFGRQILKRVYVGSDILDTYWVYDEQGNLRYIIPPGAMEKIGDPSTINNSQVLTANTTLTGTETGTYYYLPGVKVTLSAPLTGSTGFKVMQYPLNTAVVENYLFVFEYDEQNRPSGAKSPGVEWVYTIYDKNGRKMLTQNGNQRASNEWSFVKYDIHGRVILTGVCTDTRDQATLQTYVDANVGSTYTWHESRGSTVHGYTNTSFPDVSDENKYLSVSYFDDYAPMSGWGADFEFDDTNWINNGPDFPRVRGQLTGGKVRILGENTWLKSIIYYDGYLHPIQTISDHHLGRLEKNYSIYSFNGELLESKFVHEIDAAKSVSVYERFEYDHMGRVTKQWHSVDDEPEVLLAEYDYNDLGEVIEKNLHSTDNGTNFVQSVDYRYNIRGWLTNINQADRSTLSGDTDSNADLFGMELYYNSNPSGLTFTTQQNGLPAGVTWGHADLPAGTTQRSYGYSYDRVNRLTSAVYKEKNSSSWMVNNGHFDVSNIAYDHNGNILTLDRKSSNTTVDDLVYTYEGNQLTSINDMADATKGFKDGAEASVEYTYDDNGNMISDGNKLISNITYNRINLPEQVTFSNGDYIEYTYDAAGTKLKQEVWISSSLTDETDYSSGLIFEDGVLSLMSMPQGRVIVEKVADDYNYDYQYFLTDHLGNNRVMFAPQTRTYMAGMETEDATEEEAQFLNIASTRHTDAVYNHTSGGNESARLNADDDTIIGPAKGLKVYAGDTVNMEVWAKYASTSGAGQANPTLSIFNAMTAAYGVSASGETANIYTAFNNQFGSAALISQSSGDTPKAFLNYIFFDANMANPQTGFDAIISSAQTSFEKLELEFIASQEGYLFTYVSNESSLDANVYFDDFEVEHISSASVLQADDYYPFGLPITDNNYSQTGAKENRFLYQGKEWQTDLALNLYDFHARQYDPTTGRFTSVDPQDQFNSPYLGMGNVPTLIVDPDGEFGLPAFFLLSAAVFANGMQAAQSGASGGQFLLSSGLTIASSVIGGNVPGAIPGAAYQAGINVGVNGLNNSIYGQSFFNNLEFSASLGALQGGINGYSLALAQGRSSILGVRTKGSVSNFISRNKGNFDALSVLDGVSDELLPDGVVYPNMLIRVPGELGNQWTFEQWQEFYFDKIIPNGTRATGAIHNPAISPEELVGGVVSGAAKVAARLTLRKVAAKSSAALLKAASAPSKGGLTAVGRSLQKHGSRAGSIYPRATGNATSINAQGHSILKGILNNPNATTVTRHHARFGNIMDIRIPGGQGARFSADGKTFLHFLE